MRFHVLGIPHTVSSKEYVSCAFTQKIVKFCKMMHRRGHQVIHYGHEDSNVECSEHVTVLTNDDFVKCYGTNNWRKNFFKYDLNDHAYKTFFNNCIREVGKRKMKNDFILPFWGAGVRPVCDAHEDMLIVEPGIGYAGGHWAPYKVFESYAVYHAYYGLNSVATCIQKWYDTVIPNYFDLDDFKFDDKKDDYFLFLGRVNEGKGIHIAIQTTEHIGAKLKVAGPFDLYRCGYKEIPKHVEFVGYADVETRKQLMSKAKGAFVASLYNEPFCGVQIECLLSGTPTISTDWGAFTENNIHGLTGYRCRTFNDFVMAAHNISKISPHDCRKFGENFSLDNVAVKYEKYFGDILNIHGGKGWYSTFDDPSFFNTRVLPSKTEVTLDKKPGISFVVRARNEEERIEQCITSLKGITIPHEINVILHKCTDGTEALVKRLANEGYPINIFYNDKDISRAGYETIITPDDHDRSWVKYCNECMMTSKYNWLFKWDADFFATDAVINFINNLNPSDITPKVFNINVRLGETEILNKEGYLSNCFQNYVKYFFWELPVYKKGTHFIDTHIVINSISNKILKSHWVEESWFIKEGDIDLVEKYKKLKDKFGEEPLGLARASNKEADEFFLKIRNDVDYLVNNGIRCQ